MARKLCVPALGFAVAAVLFVAASRAGLAQAPTPDECFGFRFSPWDPPLRTVASSANPGGDPKSGAVAGAPREWAIRTTADRALADSVRGAVTDPVRDSLLVLFPAFWPSGITIEWSGARGDTLLGTAHAMVADGRIKSPVSKVRGIRVPCTKPEEKRPPNGLPEFGNS